MKKLYGFLDRVGRAWFGGRGFGKNTLFRKAKAIIRRGAYADFVEINGLRLYVDLVNGVIPHERYQSGFTKIFKEKIRNGDTIIDCGASAGYFTCLAARLAGPAGHVFAFEPDPESRAMLQKNVEVNRLGNVTVVPSAVSDVAGELPFFLSGAHSSLGFSRFGEAAKKTTARAVVLDDFLKDYKKPIRMVKMDIIGSESKAFAGMRRIVEKNKDLNLLLSFTPFDIRAAGDDPLAFLRRISASGFLVRNADGTMEVIPEGEFSDFVERYSSPGKVIRANLFCGR